MSMKKFFLAVVLVMLSQIASGAPFQATASWKPVTTNVLGEQITGVSYIIEEKRVNGEWKRIIETTENNAIIRGDATPSEIINYRAAVIWQGIQSDWSNEVAYSVIPIKPNAPEGFTIQIMIIFSPGPSP